MGAIQKAIREIKWAIPKEILEETFMAAEKQSRFGRRNTPISVDALIREKVINARVLEDCNLIGGTQVEIPLDNVPVEQVEVNRFIYRIPMNLTQNRPISKVLAIIFGPTSVANQNHAGMAGYSQIIEASQGMMNSHANIPVVSSAYIRLIAENVVLVSDYVSIPRRSYLSCILEYDDELSTMGRMTYPHFCKLVELAVKAYIYNHQIIPMGMGQLSGGMDLGRYREVVDGYADANQMYQEYLRDVWTKVSLMDDPKSKEKHMRMLVGGNW